MSMIVATPDQVSSKLGDEAVILNIKSGVYFGLNEVGARVWTLIQEPVSIARVIQTLLGEYDVEPEQCKEEVLSLIKELIDVSLVEAWNGKDSQISAA
jgi:hypothetical protein